jgi:hypothetical protein
MECDFVKVALMDFWMDERKDGWIKNLNFIFWRRGYKKRHFAFEI